MANIPAFLDFLVSFFKAMWDTVGGYLCCMANDAFSLGNLTASLNQGLIKFLSQNASCETIGGWRPITLLSVSCKILAKALALRMQRVVSWIVREEETGFVQGRFILDIVISAWEAMDWARETSQDFLFLKISFE